MIAGEISQEERDAHYRSRASSTFYLEDDPDAHRYHEALARAMEELERSGINDEKRFFHATTLVKIMCASKRHGRSAMALARIYSTSAGPVLVATISNDLRSRRPQRHAADPETGSTVRVRDPWFGLRPWQEHERSDGLSVPEDFRSAALLTWPDIDEFLFGAEEWEQEEARYGLLLCQTCGRRPMPRLAELLAVATEADRDNAVRRVTC